jgi:hypothetical protein
VTAAGAGAAARLMATASRTQSAAAVAVHRAVARASRARAAASLPACRVLPAVSRDTTCVNDESTAGPPRGSVGTGPGAAPSYRWAAPAADGPDP